MGRSHLFSAVALVALSGVAFADSYALTQLPQPFPGRFTVPTAMNEGGDLLFTSTPFSGGSCTLYLMKGHKFTQIPVPNNVNLDGVALTNNDAAAGFYQDSNLNSFLFSVKNGNFAYLPSPPNVSNLQLGGYNEHGDFTVNTGTFGSAAFVFRHGQFFPVNDVYAPQVDVGGISDDGTVAGFFGQMTANQPYNAFTLTKDGDYHFYKATFSTLLVPVCISHDGQWVGGTVASAGIVPAFVKERNGTVIPVQYPFPPTIDGGSETLTTSTSIVTGVNGRGDICGYAIAVYFGGSFDFQFVAFTGAFRAGM